MEIDPRLAATTVATGPADLVGNQLVKVDEVTIAGQLVHLPAVIPGIPQYVAVARAEADANALWPRLTVGLDHRGQIPFQPDAALVLDFQGAAGTVIAGAVTGLEAFSSHHLSRYAIPGQPVVYSGKAYTLKLREFTLNERYADVMPAVMGVPRPTQEPWWPKLRQIQGLGAWVANRNGRICLPLEARNRPCVEASAPLGTDFGPNPGMALRGTHY